MRRRDFITLLGGAGAWPVAARAQQTERIRRIGVLMAHAEADPEFQAYVDAFREELQKLGWTEGRNVRIDIRWGALDDAESRRRFAKELVAVRPDLILTQNTPPTASMLQQTRTIPVVFVVVADPVGSGFVENLARHRLHDYGADDVRQVAGAAQGDCAAYRPGRLPVQSGNSAIRQLLPKPIQRRRFIVGIGGDRRTCSRSVRVRVRHCRTRSQA
jgi:hypothetical protein